MHAVNPPVRNWLRLEALTVSVAGLMVWAGLDGGWWRFVLLFFVPDVALVGYLWGPRTGAAFYNAVHSYAIPLLVGLAGGVLDHRVLLLTGTLWLTHIGIDRALGYGLKYPTGFHDTHLGRIGRQPVPQALQRTGEHLIQLVATADATRSPDRTTMRTNS